MAFFDLLDGVGVVVASILSALLVKEGRSGDVRCHGDVATVEHGGPAVEGIGVEGYIVAAAESHFA